MSQPPSTAITTVQDAQKVFETLKLNLISSWTGVQTAMDFFIQKSQEQTRRIEALQAINQEKESRLTVLSQKVLELETALTSKEEELANIRTDNAKMKAAMKTGLEGVIYQRKQLEIAEARLEKEQTENEVLRCKLEGAEQRAAAADPAGSNLSQQQINTLEAKFRAELEAKTSIQHKLFQEKKESLERSLTMAQNQIKQLEETVRTKSNASSPEVSNANPMVPTRSSSSSSSSSSFPPLPMASVPTVPTPTSMAHTPSPGIFDFLWYPTEGSATEKNLQINDHDIGHLQKRKRLDSKD